ncbi:MAG: sulfatase [Thermogutta sp.]|jgi:arylsulfatase A-like enzyme
MVRNWSILMGSLLALVCGGDAYLANAGEDGRWNVVLFVVDDLGWADLGCYGSQFYETPHVDRLAAEGMRFLDAYSACQVCSPTRAAIMTGKWPQRVGITDYIGAPQPEAWKRNTRLLPAPYQTALPLEEVTFAEVLKQRGYATFFAGKWHLGPEGYWPENQGFDINMGGTGQGGPYGGNKYFFPYGNPRLPDGPPGEHLPDRLATETAKFIEQHKEGPFLAVLCFYSVHTPLMAREDLRQKYEEKRKRLGLVEKFGQEGPREVRLVQEHPVYAAMVEAMDQAVGKVLRKLDELGLAEKTVVMFTSDNGGLSTSEGWPTSNLPLRAGKGWIYEGGIRVPFIVRWPGVVPAGTICTTPVCSVDIFPTIVELSGEDPARYKVDGLSLVPLFRNRTFPADRPLFWHYPHYGNQGGAPSAAVRRGPWKLIHWYEDDSWELYNLEDDIGENRNLAGQYPEKVAELKKLLQDWLVDVGARYPTANPNYDPTKPDGRVAHRR